MSTLTFWWKKLTLSSDVVDHGKTKITEKPNVKKDTITGILSPIESYVVTAQSILIWENPMLSAVAFTFCNILFWLIAYGQYRFYFVIASITALSYIYRTWTKHIWPEIRVPVPEDEDNEEWTPVNPQVLSVPEISRYLNQLTDDMRLWVQWLINLRRDQPGQFCAFLTGILMMVWFIGRWASGILISYILMCLILIGPGFLVRIYPYLRRAISSCELISSFESTTVKQPDEVVDEYIPEANDEMMDALATALDAGLMHGKEELPENDEFVPSLNVMPSYDKDSDSETEVEDVPVTIEKPSQPSRMEAMMKFVSSHYENEDSDEADEDRLAEGLSFNDDLDSRLSGERTDVKESNPEYQEQPDNQFNPQKKPTSRRTSLQSDMELSDYEMISESELS
ncbi:hypothetical protein CHUAL_007453 [Chamberlinius hualienensis]